MGKAEAMYTVAIEKRLQTIGNRPTSYIGLIVVILMVSAAFGVRY